jgi:hypothetical protein
VLLPGAGSGPKRLDKKFLLKFPNVILYFGGGNSALALIEAVAPQNEIEGALV